MRADGAWRCFVAVAIDDGLRGELATAAGAWRQVHAADDLRWTDPAGWHLTLAFLGETDPARVPVIRHALDAVAADASAFGVRTATLGAVPSPAVARVVWLGLEDTDGHLARLAAATTRALGLDHPATFRPHLTIARARRGRSRVRLDRWLEIARPPARRLPIERLTLFRSHLGAGPAHYETLGEARLRSAADA